MLDTVSLKLAALAAAPAPLRRHFMCRRFQDEVERTGEAEMPFLGDFMRPGDLVLDIGANLGSYSYEMARLGCRVIAFEPNPAVARALGSLHLPNVEVRSCAVSNRSGHAILHLPAGQKHVLASLKSDVVAGEVTERVSVPVVRLDDLALSPVAFAKIDVEGAEEDVLAGAMSLIAKDRPALLIEIEERHNRGGLARVSGLLAPLGYACSFLHSGVWRPLSDFEASALQDPAVLAGSFPCRRGVPYVNNFLFTQLPLPCYCAVTTNT